ncbi:MAG: hypothetical protein ACI37R_07885 [Candidatus Avigastranaerophilus sp.]
MNVQSIQPVAVQKRDTAKKVAGALIATAAATSATVYLVKSGKLDKIVSAVKEKIGQSKFAGNIGRKVNNIRKQVGEIANQIAQNPKVAAVKTTVKGAVDTVTGKAVSAFNTVRAKAVSGADKAKELFHKGVNFAAEHLPKAAQK